MFYQYNKHSHPLSFEVFKIKATKYEAIIHGLGEKKGKCILSFLKLFVNHILWENASNENLN